MKLKKFEVTRRRIQVTRSLYLKWLREATQFPLTLRIAAELVRNGVTIRQFQLLHKDDYPISNRIAELIEPMFHDRGPSPELIPPIQMPLMKYQSAVELKEASFTGRPSPERAAAKLQAWVDARREQGWSLADVMTAARKVLDVEADNVPLVSVKPFEDDTPKLKKGQKAPPVAPARTKVKFRIFDGVQWVELGSGPAAKKFQEDIQAHVKHQLEAVAPLEDVHRRFCSVCKMALSGLVVINRDAKKKFAEAQHQPCWWLKLAKPDQIPLGMEMFNPADAKTYVWRGADNRGWQLKTASPLVQPSLPVLLVGAATP